MRMPIVTMTASDTSENYDNPHSNHDDKSHSFATVGNFNLIYL